jgi:nucleotide-binding universal stress UspA family protein
MNRGILVPLDGTRFAEAALPVAIYLARRDDVPLRLVTVWQPMLPLYDTSGELEAWEREWHAQRHRYLAEVARRVEMAIGRPVSVRFFRGRPGEVLPELVDEEGAALVVMATHGRGQLLQAGLGSVADEMVRKCSAPVLLIRPAEEMPEVALEPIAPFRRILVPLDGSELAESALQRSLLAGKEPPVELTLLRVLAFPTPEALPGIDQAQGPHGQIVRAEREAASTYLTGVAERLASWGCAVNTMVLEDVSPRKAIVEYAKSSGADLIAMASHGRGGAKRLLLGSVARGVVRHSPIPVLLFRPERMPSPWQDVERLAGQVVGMP